MGVEQKSHPWRDSPLLNLILILVHHEYYVAVLVSFLANTERTIQHISNHYQCLSKSKRNRYSSCYVSLVWIWHYSHFEEYEDSNYAQEISHPSGHSTTGLAECISRSRLRYQPPPSVIILMLNSRANWVVLVYTAKQRKRKKNCSCPACLVGLVRVYPNQTKEMGCKTIKRTT